MTLWGRLHFGPTFLMVAALRPSELRSSGISRWTRHGLDIMFMPLPALCVFKNHTFSLHPCCVCVWELFFDICWEKWLIYSSWGLPSHTYEVLKRSDFFNPSKQPLRHQLRHFRLSQEAISQHISSLGYAFTESWVLSPYVKNWLIYTGLNALCLSNCRQVMEKHF